MARHLGAEYLYEDERPAPVLIGQPPLMAEDLANMPAEWLTALGLAASRGRASELLQLIDQIEPDQADLAYALRILVQDLEFKRIVTLTRT